MPCAATSSVTLTAIRLQSRASSTDLKLAIEVLPHPWIPRTRRDGCQDLRLPEADDARAIGRTSKLARLKCNVGATDTRLLADAAPCVRYGHAAH